MTLSEIIEGFDKERKNELPLDIKLGWISQLDYKISSEILSDRQSEDFHGYNGTTPLGTETKAPEEYGEIYYSEIVFVKDDGMWMLKEKLEHNGKHVTDCELAGMEKYAEKVGSKFDYSELLEG